jgi:LuxR family transcriptional regulator, quorum-sensing system regulator BjaR1
MLTQSDKNFVFDTVEELSRVASPPQVSAALAAAMEKFGFSALGINGLPPPGEGADPLIVSEQTPEGFRGLYIAERFYAVDHICAHARTAVEPFRYSDAPFDRTESHGHWRFMQALQTFGMGRGLIVPFGRPAGMPACIWLAGQNPRLDDEAIVATQLVALFAAGKAHALAQPAAKPAGVSSLSKREREVLRWTAAGKTAWEISVILDLSESAVNASMAKAMLKLKAVSRVQAVVNAIRLGEIAI